MCPPSDDPAAGSGGALSGRPQPVWSTPATGAAKTRGGEPPPPRGWAVTLRASRLGELRVRLLNRVVVWSLKGRYRALLRWRLYVHEGMPLHVGWAAGGGDDARLQGLLREVADMKAQVASSRTPGRADAEPVSADAGPSRLVSSRPPALTGPAGSRGTPAPRSARGPAWSGR